ncbi:hypothetical protein AAG747_07910 [Rapidithrix thailandica]|uniref:Uncharacterized protein n=1 Tax=Rapidithrix thailandica TaxID=413964 RepID=A0AAW9RST2_9BACT
MSDSYYIINPDRKAELHFDYGEYKALPEELKKELKRYFVWGRKRKAWVSKGDHRNFSVITMVSKLDLPLKEKQARKSFAEQEEGKAAKAEYRAGKYATRAEKAEERSEQLRAEFNRLRKDWSWLTQPNVNSSGGRAFTRSRNRVMDRYDKGLEEYRKSEQYRAMAQSAATSATQPKLSDPNFLQRRIKEAQKRLRQQEKMIENSQERLEQAESEEEKAFSLESLERTLEDYKETQEKLAYYTARLNELKAGGAQVFDRESLQGALYIKSRRAWYKVVRVNKSTVTHSWFAGDFKTPHSDIQDAVFAGDEYKITGHRQGYAFQIEVLQRAEDKKETANLTTDPPKEEKPVTSDPKEKPAKKPAVKLPFKQHLAAYAAWKEVRETVEASAKEWHSTIGGRIRLSDSFELYDFDSQRVRSEDDHSFTFRVGTYLDPDKNVVIVGEHLQQIYGMRVYMRSIRKRVKPSGKQESYGFKVLVSQWTPFALPDRVQVPAGKRKPHYRLGEPKSYRDREKLRRDVLLEELMLGKLEMALESKFNGMEDMTERIPEEQQHWYVPGLSQIPEVFYRETPEHYGKNLVLWGHSGVRYALRYHHRPVPQYLDLEGKGKPEKKILGSEAKKKLAGQLRQKAESLEKKAAAKRSGGTFHQNWTPRRAGIMKSLEADAEALEQKAFAFRKLAEGWEAGSVPELLQGIRTIADLNELYSFYPTIRGNTPESYLDEARKRLERLQTMGLDSESRFQAAKKALQELAPVEPSEEAQSARRLRELEEKFRTSKQPGFFPTPKAVAEKMIALARVPEGAVILEPSAGLGHLAAEIKQAFPENKLVIGELNRSFHEVLSLKGFDVAFDDFLSYRPAEKDRPEIILMNPPFEKGQDAEHILHAFEMVKPGGQVISLASEGLFFRQSKKETAFREFLEEQGGTSEVLPEKSFTGSGAFKQTGVRTRIVVLEKPAAKSEKTVTSEPKKKPEMRKKVSVQQEILFKEDVYHFSEDQKIIRKFAGMSGKAKSRKELKNAILDLQKKAKEKRFSDPYKPLLRKLQDEAVDLYNGMERDKITRQTVEFSKSLALELEQEAQKKKLRYSVTLLKRFLNLQGEAAPEKAERLLALIQSALKKGKVPKDDPYYAKLKAVEKELSQDKSPELESRSLEGIRMEAKTPKGVMSAGDLQKMDFKVLPFSGKWAEFIGQPSENFYLIIYGKPKMGKSNLAFQLAKYLGSFGKVLYVAAEEGFGLTLKTKMEENGIAAEDPVHFSDARHLEGVKRHLDQGYAVCFIDSINVLDLEPEEFERFRKSYPNTAFVCIMQSTKSGNFRGSQEWTHNADSIVNLDEPGLATCRGRFGAGEYKIFER